MSIERNNFEPTLTAKEALRNKDVDNAIKGVLSETNKTEDFIKDSHRVGIEVAGMQDLIYGKEVTDGLIERFNIAYNIKKEDFQALTV